MLPRDYLLTDFPCCILDAMQIQLQQFPVWNMKKILVPTWDKMNIHSLSFAFRDTKKHQHVNP